MEKKKIKLKDSSSGKIANKWFVVIMLYLPIQFIVSGLARLITEKDFYGIYYQVISIDLLDFPGISLFLIGLIVDELIYFIKCKRNKNVIALISAFAFICWITCKFIPYSETYEYYKDLHYVINGTYCEDVQDLKDVYRGNNRKSVNKKTIYRNFGFQVFCR